jgi:DNA-binding protein HU-beta
MTKAELIETVQAEIGGALNKKQTGEMIDGIFDAMAEAIKTSGRLAWPQFGTFVVRERKARKGHNPQSGKEITIPASKTVAFKPAPALKDSL